MYELTRLSLKNWYLCVCEDVEYRGAIGMVGPTGSGKSALLDAIQTVVGGLNHNRIHLNASAETRSDRKIIDYCLGYLVPKKDGGEPLRPACETILVLTFAEERPDGTVHHVSVGVVMTAREGESREVPVTRFIAPGIAVSAEDWKGIDEKGRYVKDWDEIAPEMKRRCPEMREYRTGADRFVSDMLAEMRRGARQPDVNRFLNAFFNSLQFKPINNPTSFMREFILEPDDLNIERVRGQVARWREFSEAARKIEEKLETLRGINRAFEAWGRAVLDQATQGLRRSCAAVERRRLLYAAADRDWREVSAARQDAHDVRSQLAQNLKGSRDDLEQKKATLSEKGIDARLKQIDNERKLLERDLKDIETPVKQLGDMLRLVGNLMTVRDRLPGSFVPAIAGAKAALAIIEAKPGLGWLKQGADDVADHIGRLRTLSALPERLAPQREDLSGELTDLRRRRDELQANVERAGKGGAVLMGHTQALIRLLAAEGIEAVPLCEVVEVEDESWQFAVEALLGLRREALIVDPTRLNQANEILYRNRNSHSLHNCRLVKTTRTGEMDVRVRPDSIASVVKTDNRHAMAYLAMHLGGFRMAETEAELERAGRAIMRNGKATSGLDYQVHRDHGFALILGRTARERTALLATKELDEVRKEIAEKQRVLAQLEQATQVANAAVAYEVDLTGLRFAYEEVERKGRELGDRRDAVLSEADRELADEIEALEKEIAERQKEIDEQDKAINDLAKKEGILEGKREIALIELRKAVCEKRAAIKAFDTDEIGELTRFVPFPFGEKFQGAVNPFLGKKLEFEGRPDAAIADYKACEDDAEAQLRALTPDRISRMASTARNRLIESYCRHYAVEYPYGEDAPYYADYVWVVLQYKRLEGNELREHLERVQTAEKEMVSAIKEDLLSRLSDKFGKLDDQLKALNAHLRKHRFTGQVYKFGKKADPAFDKIRRLALAVAANPEEAQAIIEKRHEDPVLREAMIDLEAYIEAAGGKGLEDYRNYFSFDLYMLPEEQADEEVETVQGRMSLSARASVASGGETQAPFYVAMAASMAMAYFPGGHPASGPSGMGLVLFDEAFNKLDVPNTQALVRFFKDLGLQLMVAAPEGERPTFTEVFDTIVTVSKSKATKTVYIASDFPKERARLELAAINPNRKGVEGFRGELAAAPVVDAAE